MHPAVVNISPAQWQTTDRSLDEAIVRSIRAGFVYVRAALLAGATQNLVRNPGQAPNLLLHVIQ